jgi:thiamine pyrophosphate-dependent acetolactate synthase large subunit-like protein
LPITYVIVNNEGYGAMRSFAELQGSRNTVDFSIPGVDFCALGAAFGLHTRRVAAPAELVPALRETFDVAGPSLLDVVVDAGARKLF